MNILPDFTPHGYTAIAQLGHNQSGGRATYKAESLDTQTAVVIKEFKFNTFDSNWTGFKAFEREVEVLQQLSHPRIPQYLDSFETLHGFCLVQEYKDAICPAFSWFTPEQAKKIAESILEILIYLQEHNPPIIHKDIKPENLLLDKDLNAYLIDFGFAKIGTKDLGLSSMVVGTSGFMPPEQLLNRELSPASDLYSLGVTLFCLMSSIRSERLSDIIDENFQLNIDGYLPSTVDTPFRKWLKKLVKPRIANRFQSASEALKSLQAMDLVLESGLLAVGDGRLSIPYELHFTSGVACELSSASNENDEEVIEEYNFTQPTVKSSFQKIKQIAVFGVTASLGISAFLGLFSILSSIPQPISQIPVNPVSKELIEINKVMANQIIPSFATIVLAPLVAIMSLKFLALLMKDLEN